MDIERLCPGCMRELDVQVRKAGMRDAEMEGMNAPYEEMRAAGVPQHGDRQGGAAGKAGKCPYCGFNAAIYRQNARCLPINTILAGKYLVGAVLGEGGFGITYMGYDLNMETRIAIKEYFPVELVSRDTTSMTGDRVISMGGDKSVTYKQGLEKYVTEAQSVSQFSETPGVVSVKDFFYENETAYIVMEYIEGISLKDYLKERGGRLSEEESLVIMKPVLEALVKVHEAGIIHRDISPDNIMLSFSEGRIASVKLIDFGAARMTAKDDQKSLTIILKHGYAPEEQYRTHGEQGPWTDVYAVCAVLYRMLTGETPVSAMDRLFQDGLKSFGDLSVNVTKNTQAAILKGLAVKKEDRLQGIPELTDALYGNKNLSAVSGMNKYRKAAAAALMAVLLMTTAVFLIWFLPDVGDSGKLEEICRQEGQSGVPAGQSLDSQDVLSEDYPDQDVRAGESQEFVLDMQEKEELGEIIVFPDPQTSISAVTYRHALFRMPDGSVKAVGSNECGQCMVENWSDIAAVSAGYKHSLGLRADGRVFAVGDNWAGQCDVENWEDVVQIAAGNNSSYGLTREGRILACGYSWTDTMDAVTEWENIVAITTELNDGLIGLDRDGNVHFAGCESAWTTVSGWQGVKYLAYRDPVLTGLREDGTIVREQAGGEGNYQEEVKKWEGMQQICSNIPVMGVRGDGTVAFTEILDPQAGAELAQWKDMTAVASMGISDRIHIVGLERDGSIREYRQYYGNVTPEQMHDLEWIQTMNVDNNVNLVACTKAGQILTYGTEPFRMDDLAALYESEQAPPLRAAGIVGMDALLLEDGSLYYCGHFLEDRADPLIGENVVEALEVWKRNYDGLIYGYAILTEDGHIRTEIVGDMERAVQYTKERGIEEWTRQITEFEKAEEWTDVIQIAATEGFLYGLHRDGSISTTVFDMPEIPAEDIIRMACGPQEIIGIKSDGTAEVILADDSAIAFGRTQVNSWDNLQDISIGESHVVGLQKDGTVVATGSNHANQCDVEDWENIVSILADKNCTLGITADGELKMAGSLY